MSEVGTANQSQAGFASSRPSTVERGLGPGGTMRTKQDPQSGCPEASRPLTPLGRRRDVLPACLPQAASGPYPLPGLSFSHL